MSVSEAPARPVVKPKPKPQPKAGFDRGAFYRLCRMLHAYFSAFAFLALIFFSATGVMLNHPAWFDALTAKEKVVEVVVPADAIAKAKTLDDPGPALVAATGRVTPLRGAYSSADIQGDDALLRMDGPKGTSVIELNLASGKAKVTTDKANTLLMIQDLHRGKNSGAAWRWVIDLSAYIILALSVIGYVLFFSLRFRLRTSLILTAVSLLVLVGIAAVFVP